MLGFISKIFQNKQLLFVILGAAIVVLFGVLMHTCERNNELKDQMEQQEKRYENNLKALNDTIRVKENKIGEKTSSIRALKTDMDNLELLNDSLHNVVNQQDGKIQSLISLLGDIDVGDDGGLDTDNEVNEISEGYYGLDFNSKLRQKGLKIDLGGSSRFYLDNNGIRPDSTHINDFNVRFALKTGFREYEDRYEVFATPVNPNISIAQLQGVQIIAKQSNNNNPVQNNNDIFNVSVGTTFGYDVINNRFANVTGVHIGINIFNF